MGEIKALLIGVCDYFLPGCMPLPLCKNDLYELKESLIKGLNVKNENIILCGETGIVTIEDFKLSFNELINETKIDDIFIFYFSGHGTKGGIALSDKLISLQDIIELIERIESKNKIIILDSCHSGTLYINGIPQLNINESVEHFASHGYAVLSSCNVNEFSGFDKERKISLYTRFLCDALMARFLIKKGRKSLEEINNAIFHLAKIYNDSNPEKVQHPIFRSNVGGTIFFDVEEYNPYKRNQVYEENDDYIIYKVHPIHHAGAKRFLISVLLRFKMTMEEMAKISEEIRKKAIYYEVFENDKSERYYKGKKANFVRCSFGYDEDDMIDKNFFCYSTWVDESLDKEWWYKKSSNTKTILNVHFTLNENYLQIKKLKDNELDKKNFIRLVRENTAKIVSLAERYIKLFRDYLNKDLTENEFMKQIEPLNDKISECYFNQSNLPIAPNELHNWSRANDRIVSTINDFTYFFSKKGLQKYSKDNREWLLKDSINRYTRELEELKEEENMISLYLEGMDI